MVGSHKSRRLSKQLPDLRHSKNTVPIATGLEANFRKTSETSGKSKMHEIKTYGALLPAKSGYKPGETMDSLTGRTWEGLIGNPISIQTSGLIQPEKPICFSLRPGVGKAETED